MLQGSEFNIQFRTHLGCFNLKHFGEGLIRFSEDRCEIEGKHLRKNPGCLRGCWGFCLGAAFDCACCGIGNYVLVVITAFTIKPLIWMFGSEESVTELQPGGKKPVVVKGRLVSFYATTPDSDRYARFCILADTEGLAKVIGEKLEDVGDWAELNEG